MPEHLLPTSEAGTARTGSLKSECLRVVALCVLTALSLAQASDASNELRIVRAEERATVLESRTQARSSRLFMPIARSDLSSGVLSLYALRNVSNSTITVSSLFILADGELLFRDDILGPKDTITINVRDLALPVDPDLQISLAVVDFAVVDPTTGQPIDDNSLVGDWFLVDPGNNLSIGDPLISNAQLCDTFNTRFAQATSGFDGSEFVISIPDYDPESGPTQSITGLVYDEAGVLTDTFAFTTDKVVTVIDTALLTAGGVDLPSFGSIEWRLGNGRVGMMTWAMNAEKRYSVGMTASCIE